MSFGRWTVLKRAEDRAQPSGQFRGMWHCRCSCGNDKVIEGGSLREGKSRSCGCLSAELTSQREWKHGQSHTREHLSWLGMTSRCRNPNNQDYRDYGGRGITVDPRWLGEDGFQNFYADLGPKPSAKHTLGRIDNDGNYGPSNCEWQLAIPQANNKRTNIRYDYRGKKMTLRQLMEEVGSVVSIKCARGRIRRGWDWERALKTPYQHRPQYAEAAE